MQAPLDFEQAYRAARRMEVAPSVSATFIGLAERLQSVASDRSQYVASDFSRTRSGPAEAGHHVQRGPGLLLEEVLPIARQIADALEAPSAPDLSQTPTMTSPAMTGMGAILGTAAYMSPEQARGRAVDKRTDIWAFGCVLYEMLTGHATFARETIADTLAAIIERDPEWKALPPATPPAIVRLLRRCLEKDAGRRLHDVADVRIEIDEASSSIPRPQERAASIAVLAFTDMSAAKDQDWFCDGIAEEILNALTPLKGLRVAARTSAFSFKGKGDDLRTIGEKLNVTTVLEGSVRRSRLITSRPPLVRASRVRAAAGRACRVPAPANQGSRWT